MAKVLLIVMGALAGAIGGVLIVFTLGMALDRGPADSWNFGLGIMIFSGAAVAALLGGLLGGVAGWLAGTHGLQRGAIVFAASMAGIATLALLGAAGLWAMISMPTPSPSARDRERWAKAQGQLEPIQGQTLASSLIGCYSENRSLHATALVGRGCAHYEPRRIGVGGTGYDPGDDGWRWESVAGGTGQKVVVRPDPLLKQRGPVFEFGADGLLQRRDAPDAPAHAVVPPLGHVARFRQCLLEQARAAEAKAEWNGDWTAAVDRMALERSCPGLRLNAFNEHDGRRTIRLSLNEESHVGASFYPKGYARAGAFEFHVVGFGRRYLLTQDGTWHVKPVVAGGLPTLGDPPPEPCELDPRVPCPSDEQRAARKDDTALYRRIARQIRRALMPEAEDHIVIRYDPAVMPGLERMVKEELQQASPEMIPYGPVENFEAVLNRATVYVWLPEGSLPTTDDQRAALARWTDQGGTRRELHVHWAAGTLDLDGLPTTHSPEMDAKYLAAIEHSSGLTAYMAPLIRTLRSGEVRVTTPAGTDIRFQVGDRPFNMQHGAATASAARAARIRIDRHIELPPGVIRVAPLESSVNGVMAFPSFRIREGVRATDVRLEFTNGRIIRATADERQAELENYLRSQPTLRHFREFCLGMNPALAMMSTDRVIPYYGYGEGVVRMSLGDNEELGGTVRGGAVRWNFFTDATVTVSGKTIVNRGRLTRQF